METLQDVLGAQQLLLELSAPSGSDEDLSARLHQLAAGLEARPELGLAGAAELLLRNPRRELVPAAVAGQGLADSARAALAGAPGAGPQPCAEDRRFALPLHFEGRDLGFVVLQPRADAPAGGADSDFPAALAWVLAGLVHRQATAEALRVREVELEAAHLETIHRLGAAAEVRDHETGWHVLRMAHYAKAVARALGLDAEVQARILVAAPMHDIGKLGIPDAILQKQGRLDPGELQVMRTHPALGGRILAGGDPLLQTASGIAAAHHEHWDRSGYPEGLGGEEIPLAARICAVADVFDALTSSRPYKPAWALGSAIEDIRAGAGSRFDPAVVDAFLQALPEILRIRQLFRDEVIDPNEILSLPEPGGGADSSWDPSLSVGIAAIDAHHRFLFGLVDELAEAVAHRRGARPAARMLRALDLYASVHFQAEERMMQHHGFADGPRHEQLHRSFAERLQSFHAEMHDSPLTTPWDLLRYLQDWLVTHIRDEDTGLRTLVR